MRLFIIRAAIVVNLYLAILITVGTLAFLFFATSLSELLSWAAVGCGNVAIFAVQLLALTNGKRIFRLLAGGGIAVVILGLFGQFIFFLTWGLPHLPLSFWLLIPLALLNIASLAALRGDTRSESSATATERL